LNQCVEFEYSMMYLHAGLDMFAHQASVFSSLIDVSGDWTRTV